MVADVGVDELLAHLEEGSEAVLHLGESSRFASTVKVYGGRALLKWRPSGRMRKKDELKVLTGPSVVRVSCFQPFFKFVNTNGSRLVRCLFVDQGFLETSPESPLFDAMWTVIIHMLISVNRGLLCSDSFIRRASISRRAFFNPLVHIRRSITSHALTRSLGRTDCSRMCTPCPSSIPMADLTFFQKHTFFRKSTTNFASVFLRLMNVGS